MNDIDFWKKYRESWDKAERESVRQLWIGLIAVILFIVAVLFVISA